jgi:ABC-type lipoprotein export system ATPase subunit
MDTTFFMSRGRHLMYTPVQELLAICDRLVLQARALGRERMVPDFEKIAEAARHLLLELNDTEPISAPTSKLQSIIANFSPAWVEDEMTAMLRETLDISISDGAGVRDYEMYSGGEAFRVNFAVRLALSEVLARRAGARLQTLVIDEGFGSQDEAGRQRLIEAINMVRGDFAKVLVITHIESLKDAFPTRIEVEKGPGGSQVTVNVG